MGFWGLGFHFQRKGGGFRREKRGSFSAFPAQGVPAKGSRAGFARVVGVLLARRRRGTTTMEEKYK